MGGFDLKKFMITGGGFMIDQYNLFIISHVMHTIALSQPLGIDEKTGHDKYLTPTSTQSSVIKGLSLVGAVAGQLTFGTIGDVIGRREAFIGTLVFVVLGALMSTFIPGNFPATSGENIYWYLGIFQFLLGFGVGGEYPLSASVSRESSPDLKKVGYTFCMQGAGFLLGPVVFLTLANAVFPSDDPSDMEGIWRCALFFSVIPAALLIRPRANMLPARNEDDAKARGIGAVMNDHTELVDGVKTQIPSGQMWRRLVGTAFNWFIFDVSFYGNSILASDAFRLIGLGEAADTKPHDSVVISSKHMLMIAFLSIPGYIVSILTVDSLGLYKIQMLGFVAMTLLFAGLAIWYETLKANPNAFLAVYGLTFFFSNWGPNFTTYIVPTLLFPVEIRARCHGISAASGKAGAAVGVFVLASIIHAHSPGHNVDMSKLKEQNHQKWQEYTDDAALGFKIVAALCTVVGILGIISTILLTPNNPEEIAGAMEYETKEEPMACIAVVEDDSEDESEGVMDMA